MRPQRSNRAENCGRDEVDRPPQADEPTATVRQRAQRGLPARTKQPTTSTYCPFLYYPLPPIAYPFLFNNQEKLNNRPVRVVVVM